MLSLPFFRPGSHYPSSTLQKQEPSSLFQNPSHGSTFETYKQSSAQSEVFGNLSNQNGRLNSDENVSYLGATSTNITLGEVQKDLVDTKDKLKVVT